MDLPPKTERLNAAEPGAIARAAEILRNGGTVAFPTETVYGLGANALSNQAVARIFEAKKRPGWDPLIVHIADREMLSMVVSVGAWGFSPTNPSQQEEGALALALTCNATSLMDRFWPGPLTLLLPRTSAIPDAVTAGRPLVGVRMPNHPVALELIRQAGIPIAAPSANLFGHTSPTTAAHVLADLDGRIDAVLDGGATDVGVESTVAAITPDGVVVYRPGAITIQMLEQVVGAGGVQMYLPTSDIVGPSESAPSPGVSLRHYAPKARLLLVEVPHFRFGGLQNELLAAIGEAAAHHELVGAMLPDDWSASSVPLLYQWGPWGQPDVLARRLFSGLRALDDAGVSIIVCPLPTGDGLQAAIRDRLQKAAREK